MVIDNDVRRSIMLLAWDIFRGGGAPFGEALRAAWRATRRLAEAAQKMMRRARRGGRLHLRLSPSLGHSPIERATMHQTYGAVADHHAAYTTSKFGY